MCGILGVMSISQNSNIDSRFKHALDLIKHRGPDSYGIHKTSNIIFGHRRLSILDLSKNGAQPMISKCKRFVITFNGEIYNHLRLRGLLKKDFNISDSYWEGSSDTETLLAMIAHYGLDKALSVARGMFAFGLWDTNLKKLFLVRDRIGEKPLYFHVSNNQIIFSSEVLPIKELMKNSLRISRNSLNLYFRYSYIPAPFSIFTSTFKVLPGSYLEIDLTSLKSLHSNISNPSDLGKFFQEKIYWSLEESAAKGFNKQFTSQEESEFEIERILEDTISLQQISDVPIGCFLSGGIDSSLVSILMNKVSNSSINTFNIGFKEKEYDESQHALRVANSIGSNHFSKIITMQDAAKISREIPNIYDEPFADSSQIPTYIVSKLAREHVTVSLSGDGGDEFFGGYNRHFKLNNLHKIINKIPSKLKPYVATYLRIFASPIGIPNRALQVMLPEYSRILTNKIANLSEKIISSSSKSDLYKSFLTDLNDPSELVLGSDNEIKHFLDGSNWPTFNNFENVMMMVDAKSYLPDDIMVKVDRAAMAVSLETRAPFLDPKVIEASFRVPLELKIANKQGKIILKNLLGKYLDREFFTRSKQGFGIPLNEWIRGYLKYEFLDVLSQENILKFGYLNNKLVQKKLDQHMSGKYNWGTTLWNIYIFQLWCEKNI